MSLVDDLKAARAVIADPKHWIKGAMAKPNRTSPLKLRVGHHKATCFCAVGALARAIPRQTSMDKIRFSLAVHYLKEAIDHKGYGRNIAAFNDRPGIGHTKVLKAFDLAIAFAEQDSIA